MEHALTITEIREMICTFASDHTLARLARTCKAFHEPSIQVLWCYLSDISPLFHCFPQDAYAHTEKLNRPLTPEEWTRVLKYSSLALAASFCPEEALYHLSAFHPTLVFFPNLVIFEWSRTHTNVSELPVVLRSLSPNLRILRLSAIRSGDNLQPTLSLIASRFGSLEEFNMNVFESRPGDDSDPVMPYFFFSAIQNRYALKVIQCNGILVTEDGLLVLSRLPNLNKLAIRLPRSFTLSADTDSLEGFASLRDITVTAIIPDYIHFSDKTALPRVASMRIQVEGTPDNGDILRLFASIPTNFSPAMITKLFVSDRQPNHQAVICLPYLQPLFELSNLAVFELSMAARYVLDGAAYTAIAQAWPLLESIDIGVADICVRDETHPVTIVDALLPFAVHCPKLTHLGVWFSNSQLFDSWIPERIEEVASQVRPNASLVTSLDVVDSPVYPTHKVAAFLAMMFPKLDATQFQWRRKYSRLDCPSKKEMRELFLLFAMMRRVERREVELQEE
ncbi:hypothetical protein BD311DRAFT_787500 [Dichomitus squalens]|uniref:F-box domain-containing protein n=1 Tax=Dichomitus squalens TaxID=114155 RepID=A0A4V2K0S7_9APHY|nr:hypothetical protein BD311DRAFT_787500 [Dichomitus squalens]